MKTLKKFLSIALCLAFVNVYAADEHEGAFKVGKLFYKQLTGSNVCVAAWCDSGGETYYTGDIEVPSEVVYEGVTYTVTELENSAFQGGRYITSIKLPGTLKTIGWWAFMECSAITSIEIPESVETISDGAFSLCSALKEITVPAKVKKVNWYTFAYCSSLKKVTLWDGVITVDQGAFAGSTAIKTLIVLADNPPSLAEDSFDESLTDIDVFVLCNHKDAYDNSDWKFFTNIQEDCNLSGLDGIADNNLINIYPNPATDFINVSHQGNVTITNSLGQTIYNAYLVNDNNKINIRNWDNGVYFIKAGNKVSKLIKR